jgi:FAD/FMN-containing dehydrogenase
MGPLEEADAAFRPVREFGPPLFEHLGPMPFPMLQSMFDPLYPPGLQHYWKGDFVKELSEEAIQKHAQHGAAVPTLHSSMHLYPIDGAAHRASNDQTAFAYRDANFSSVMAGIDPDPAARGRITAWSRGYWEALHPYSAGGAYVNFLMEEGQERVRATYRDNYARLAQIKTEYDPENLFRMNQNIAPE